MLVLYLQAPFAVFRTFTAGSFRPSAAFITPSAAYGLLLNVAGIEMREHSDKKPMTLIRKGLPEFSIALGALKLPGRHVLMQQLHNYPIGTSAKEHASHTKGSKYNIVPVQRSILSDIEAYIVVDKNPSIEESILQGLAGNTSRTYGLSFLGDNNFLVDRLEAVKKPQPAYWFRRIDESDKAQGLPKLVTRLTCLIDREDMTHTSSYLFVPISEKSRVIPQKAWVTVGYP